MALSKITNLSILDDTIVNADVNSSAAIALSKLATDPSNATNLASGTVPTARLGSGTASSSTVLYGDQTYKAEPGGGKILQVTNAAFLSSTAVTATSATATHVVGAITPTSSSSKIIVIFSGGVQAYEGSGTNCGARLKVYRDIGGGGYADSIQAGEINHQFTGASAELDLALWPTIIFQDSPATTSEVSYKLYAQCYATDSVTIGYLSQMTSMVLLETDES